ncbi:DUF4079 domain-containing protein [Acaryochloris sp. CCMEE 5410]|uniref:DUF4079 domain-containing protein n=1 Tax=Acaryochloris sp. CCMEE 5410 TaxID=310037 RepID=UPI000493C67F|nr:DUF4079 domain-containing protein [Acaryochloris sp. CCMEE 5410]KAI9129335.1 DUF4079 domain-containing protein [Acaryochloris sp. CCMEE 5410]
MDSPPPFLFASITAFSMTLAVCLYLGLCILGFFLRKYRLKHGHAAWGWLRYLHYGLGITFVLNILELMTFGIIGANIYDGTEGHSPHLPAGLFIAGLAIISAWSASRVHPKRPWARPLHVSLNGLVFVALILVSWTGWSVLQENYIP